MINVEPRYKTIRHETVYEHLLYLRDLSSNRGLDFFDECEKSLSNIYVVTGYNNYTYKMVQIEFGMTPLTEFQYGEITISYAEYIKQKHGIELADLG